MTSLTVVFDVVLMQTATSLPVFWSVALPAGTLADIIDRRRLLLQQV